MTIKKEHILAILFTLSGFSAIIYQMVWQRLLFSHFGVNLEAVTVIVSFELGSILAWANKEIVAFKIAPPYKSA